MTNTLEARRIVPESVHREDPAEFVRWALAALKIPVACGAQDAVVELPEADRAAFGGQQRLRLPLTGAPTAGQESLSWDGRFGRWLVERIGRSGPALHARPAGQPASVSEIAARLFPAYQIDKGHLHLAGCQLTDHPFVRLSFAGADGDESIRHVFVAPDGSSVSAELAASLGLDRVEPLPKAPQRIDAGLLQTLDAAARRIAAKQSTARDPQAVVADPVATAVVWVRHVEGRLQFAVGGASAALPFSSWAALLAPKPFVARHSGAATFHLAATDDGRIDAAEQVVACQHSGRRVLRQDLVECSVTGKHVLADFTETCPVSGRPALRHEFVACSMCRQRVSKAVLSEGVCSACRGLQKVSKDDPRIAWILSEHAGLDRWKGWQLAETRTVYVAQATRMLKRLLLIVDKESLAVHRLAVAGRVGSTWIDANEADQADTLR